MERCQGFPDGYTDIVFNGKQASYAQRKRVLGNAFCVPVVRWIGERIALVDPYVRMYDT
jgi:DNA (cytosine-5)-methyltransferase 1